MCNQTERPRRVGIHLRVVDQNSMSAERLALIVWLRGSSVDASYYVVHGSPHANDSKGAMYFANLARIRTAVR
jgi:hypothetical protein